MQKTVAPIRAAVEKFSVTTSPMKKRDVSTMYLNALGCAPSGVCSWLRMWAVSSTNVPLAISDGCNGMPKKFIHRAASLVLVPKSSTHNSNMGAMIHRMGVQSLKYRHGMLSTKTITPMPRQRYVVC